jgi:glutaredoxin
MRRLRILIPALALLAAPPGIPADLYKWTDESGRVHYSDSPPPERSRARKIDVKINSISGPPVVSTISSPSRPQAAGGSQPVRMYMTTWCGYCKKAKAYLSSRGIPFQELNVETSESARREFDALGGRGVPVILVGDQRMDGYDESTLAALLKNAGM